MAGIRVGKCAYVCTATMTIAEGGEGQASPRCWNAVRRKGTDSSVQAGE